MEYLWCSGLFSNGRFLPFFLHLYSKPLYLQISVAYTCRWNPTYTLVDALALKAVYKSSFSFDVQSFSTTRIMLGNFFFFFGGEWMQVGCPSSYILLLEYTKGSRITITQYCSIDSIRVEGSEPPNRLTIVRLCYCCMLLLDSIFQYIMFFFASYLWVLLLQYTPHITSSPGPSVLLHREGPGRMA